MKKFIFIFAISIVFFASFIVQSDFAKAAELTNIQDTLSRLKASTLSDHLLQFETPTGVGSGTIVVDFNTDGFSSGSVDYTDIDMTYGVTGTETSAVLAAVAGVGTWGATIASNDLTLTYPTSGGTAIAASDIVIIKIGLIASGGNAQYLNPTAGNKVITITAGSDSGKLAVAIIADDQIAVSGEVNPTISFAISTNTVGFGDIDSSLARWATTDGNGSATAPVNGAFYLSNIGTNAGGGLSITTQSLGNGLSAGLYGATIIGTPLILATGTVTAAPYTEAYGFCAKNETSITVTAGADCTTGTFIMTFGAQTFASTTGPFTGGYVEVDLKGSVASDTAAGAYTDSLTIIATGNF